jgi:hypothetical protein
MEASGKLLAPVAILPEKEPMFLTEKEGARAPETVWTFEN